MTDQALFDATLPVNADTDYSNADTDYSDAGAALMLPLGRLVPFKLGNTRPSRDPVKYAETKVSIAAQGINQPILVRPEFDDTGVATGNYEVVAGWGRWEIAKELELPVVPALCKVLSDLEGLEAQITENANREDLSLVMEARAAQRYMAAYNGDKESARLRLGWSPRKLAERLELMKASDAVLDALDKGLITPRHAMLLAPLPHKLQDGTLPKVIDEGWTPEQLRERATKAKHPLASAIFDQTACATCPHNTSAQRGLFDAVDDGAQCANLPCFVAKTNEELAKRMVGLEEQYGKVLLLTEVGDTQRTTVTEAMVGAEQFVACMQCEKRVAVLNNSRDNPGEVIESQCMDSTCLTKCRKTLDKAKKAAEAAKTTSPATTTAPAAVAASQRAQAAAGATSQPVKTTTAATVTATLSRGLIDFYRTAMRATAAAHLMQHPTFKHALVLTLLTCRVGTGEVVTSKARSSAADCVIELMAEDLKSLSNLMNAATDHIATNVVEPDSRLGNNVMDLMLAVFAAQPDAKAVATAAWSPTEELLNHYTKDGIAGLCKESGMSAEYDTKKGSAAFAKLSTGSKADFIKGILAFEFDWSGYAPVSGYLSLLK